jgi:hypothetical protein
MSQDSGFSSKICSVCGLDCSNSLRTRDRLGNYVCKACLDLAAAAKAANERARYQAANSAKAVSAPPPGEDDNSVILNIGVPVDAPRCPACGVPISKKDAVLCTSCGFDFRKGERMSVRIKRQKPQKK